MEIILHFEQDKI